MTHVVEVQFTRSQCEYLVLCMSHRGGGISDRVVETEERVRRGRYQGRVVIKILVSGLVNTFLKLFYFERCSFSIPNMDSTRS